MNDVIAAIGLEQLKQLNFIVNESVKNSSFFDVALKHCNYVHPVRKHEFGVSSCWLYTVLSPFKKEMIQHLQNYGVMADETHIRNDIYPNVKNCSLVEQRKLVGVDKFEAENLCIPSGFWLDAKQSQYIAEVIHAFDFAINQ